jgi:hypothetical protein
MSNDDARTVPPTDPADLPAPSTAKTDWELERIRLLFDYTKFHIGMYATLAAVLVATLGSKFAAEWEVWEWSIAFGIIFIALAGMAGGIVAATLPHVAGNGTNFLRVKTGPVASKWARIKKWTHVEHILFWIGVGLVLGGFAPVLWQDRSDAASVQSLTITGYKSLSVNGETIEITGAKDVKATK